ncbi:putative RNA-directed DNA polymerase, eukaryota, reverse transcriptase zinc-binding domain protein, partial [Tanacetum coccineum]
EEFKIQKGLRQGDPLSPFLFIIAVEALHVTIQEAKSKNIFEGVKVGTNGVDISHLQFADDSLIMGNWSLENVKNLCRILRCFHLASGLKVNFFKSKFFGVGVTDNDTHTFASILNLQPSSFPCTYLGLPIGANMCKSRHWKPIIDKFHKRLSSWKAKNLSYGGRLMLLKSVLGALGICFFSLFKAPVNYLEKLRRNFLRSSLLATNFAMLSKWWWRFHTDTNSLWRSIIISIHGDRGGFDYNDNSFIRLPPSPWKIILGINKPLLTVNVDLNSIFSKRIGNGTSSRFWNAVWFGTTDLKSLFPCLHALETDKGCLVSARCMLLSGVVNFCGLRGGL